jgi:NAD(P)H-hydrate epimerase
VTLAFPKIGLYQFPGAERAGKLKIADIGIPAALADGIPIELMTASWAKDTLPPRPRHANKGTFGKVLVAAASINYIGSAYLASSGAMRVGAGLVTLATAGSLQPILAAKLTEATYLPLPEAEPGIISAGAAEVITKRCRDYDALLTGCGLGQHPSTANFLTSLLAQKELPALVLDADALNILASTPDRWKRLPDDAVLTPHPGEMSRLCGLSIAEIQADRTGTAMKYAAAWNKTIVLKGGHVVIADPQGRCRVSPFANPVLATAGTGDVLAGIIAGLAAQGLPLYDAASLGVYIGGEAAETLSNIMGDTGVVASDLLMALPVAIKQLKENTNSGGG